MAISAHDLCYRAGGQLLLDGVSIAAESGCVHAVIGPNGAGKSTLLRLLAGDLKPDSGEIRLGSRPLENWNARERACLRAVLPQSEQLRFGFSAQQVVALGRLCSGQMAPQHEEALVEAALAAVGAAGLAQRRYTSLSGGERARIQLARVFAQVWLPTELGTRCLLLDEPTASLDLAHQQSCLQAIRRYSSGGVGVIAVLHDANLALAHADRVTLLDRGRVAASGTPAEVLTPANLRRVYGVEMELLSTRDGRRVLAVAG